MPERAERFVARLLVSGCAALLLLSGCGSIKDSFNANQDMRKGAVNSARTSCVQTATAKLKGTSPQAIAKLTSYCDCFATKGLEKFTNTELMELGLSGGRMSDETKAKLNSAIQMCVSTLREPQP